MRSPIRFDRMEEAVLLALEYRAGHTGNHPRGMYNLVDFSELRRICEVNKTRPISDNVLITAIRDAITRAEALVVEYA